MTMHETLWYSWAMPSSVRNVWLSADEWTDWTKLALFASDSGDGRQIGDVSTDSDSPYRSPRGMARIRSGIALKLPELGWVSGWGKLAVMVDLPGKAAIAAGIALGRSGVRPVMCINCSSDTDELVDMSLVKRALVSAAHRPSVWRSNEKGVAFLLDSRRFGVKVEPPRHSELDWIDDMVRRLEGYAPSPRVAHIRGPAVRTMQFDNRWTLYDTDLPDHVALAKAGIDSVVVLQEGQRLNADVSSIVAKYQDAGVVVGIADTEKCAISPAVRQKRSWFMKLADAVRGGVDFNFNRRADGSYGRRVPVPPEPSHG